MQDKRCWCALISVLFSFVYGVSMKRIFRTADAGVSLFVVGEQCGAALLIIAISGEYLITGGANEFEHMITLLPSVLRKAN